MNRFGLTAARIFDGDVFHRHCAVIIHGGHIEALLPLAQMPADIPLEDRGAGILAPGFIDVQVNGGGGALLNATPDVETVRHIARAHRRFGTTGLLPTVITDAPAVMQAAVNAVRAAQAHGVPGILGVHVEGPFLDPARRGAHPPAFIRRPDASDIAWLAQADCGVVLATLCPAHVDLADISRLVDQGVIVSLGHSGASAVQALAALAAGARGFTHLYNAMSQLSGRDPGMVGAALAQRDCFCGLICDGYHVDALALRIAVLAKSPDSLVLVSDAMPPAADGPDHFDLQGRHVTRTGGRLQLEDGTLAGSNLTMDAALRYAIGVLDVDPAQALRMAGLNPARFIRLDHALGRIRPGYAASLVHLDDDFHVQGTWIAGSRD